MPSEHAKRLERAIRGWLEGDDEAESMAEVIDRECDLLVVRAARGETGEK